MLLLISTDKPMVDGETSLKTINSGTKWHSGKRSGRITWIKTITLKSSKKGFAPLRSFFGLNIKVSFGNSTRDFLRLDFLVWGLLGCKLPSDTAELVLNLTELDLLRYFFLIRIMAFSCGEKIDALCPPFFPSSPLSFSTWVSIEAPLQSTIVLENWEKQT